MAISEIWMVFRQRALFLADLLSTSFTPPTSCFPYIITYTLHASSLESGCMSLILAVFVSTLMLPEVQLLKTKLWPDFKMIISLWGSNPFTSELTAVAQKFYLKILHFELVSSKHPSNLKTKPKGIEQLPRKRAHNFQWNWKTLASNNSCSNNQGLHCAVQSQTSSLEAVNCRDHSYF